MDKGELTEIFDKYCKKLRIVPAWDEVGICGGSVLAQDRRFQGGLRG